MMDILSLAFVTRKTLAALSIFLLLLTLPYSAFAECYVTWNCGSSRQCAQLYGAASGRNGPFQSCSGFVQRDMASRCSCESSGGGVALPSNDPATALGTALGNALADAIFAPPTPKTPEQIEQERQADLARQKAEAERQQKIREYEEAQARAKKEKEAQLDREAQDSLALLGASAKSNLSDEELLAQSKKNNEKKSENYNKAFHHATQCISRNAGTTCSSGTAEQTMACVRDYNAGYDAGAKKVEIEMNEAYDAGYGAGVRGALDNGAADPRAVEGCRVQWIEAYSRGHFAGKTKKLK